MIVDSVKFKKSSQAVITLDCSVGDGYIQTSGGSLPDVDCDFASDRRQDIKEYLERRYNHDGKQRVFSAGTLTTLKLKACIKDIARTHRVPVSVVNYITAIFEDNMSWTDLFKLAYSNKKVHKFVQDNPIVIEEIRALMGQPRSASIHASAIIVTPDQKDGEEMECFDFTPIKKVDGVLISELDGYSIDDVGLLKNDILGTKELAKLKAIMDKCNEIYGANISLESIVSGAMDDEDVYKLLSNGFTQNVFQFSSRGMTKFLMDLKPRRINDLIAANALYRPATLESGSTEKYVDCHNGDVAPVYLWGTHNALKDTYGLLCIAEDSLVSTSKGLKKIQQVNAGELVLTEDGTYHQVMHSMYKGEKETVRVRTTHGEELVCTPDHKVLTQFGWTEAGKLKPNFHLIKSFWMSEECEKIGTMRDWCLGIYLANGNWGAGSCTISCRNKEEAEITASKFNECFDLNCYVYFHTRCWYIRLNAADDNGKAHNQATPNTFRAYLKSLNLDNSLSYDKHVPIPVSVMLLTGFIEGDGCTINGRIRLVNRYLAKQIFYGLQSFRVPSSYYEDIENGQYINTVAFNDNSVKKLQFVFKKHNKSVRNVGCMVPAKYLETANLNIMPKSTKNNVRHCIRLNKPCYLSTVEKYGGKCDHEVWGMVLSVKECDERRTYDLSIDTNHSFCVGGLVVHNCYQEQISTMAKDVGNFSLGDGVRLMKIVSKKKADKMAKEKDKFLVGAKIKGCPDEDAIAIWHMIESGASYLFNKSHATAYAITSYVGAYLKMHYPSAFYTVALQWAKDDDIPALMSEMEQCSTAKIVKPDINVSGVEFFTDYSTDEIFWSLTRIKQVGVKAVDCITAERKRGGAFTSIENFIHRIFKYKLKKYEYWDDPDNQDEIEKVPVNARHVRNLIIAGCFDEIECVGSVVERYAILTTAAHELGFELKENEFPSELIDKHYFWTREQVNISGIGSVDYRRIYDNSDYKDKIKGKARYMSLKEAAILENEGKRISICATLVDIEEKSYKDKTTGKPKTFCKIKLQQNNDIMEMVMWDDSYSENKAILANSKDKIIIATAMVRYSDYTGSNNLQSYKSSFLFKV